MKFTELELKYIRDNHKTMLPREIADKLGIAVTRVRTQIDILESEEKIASNPPTEEIQEPATGEQKQRTAVMDGMKGKTEGVLVMTPAASERGDEFRKTFRPKRFDNFTRKIYREK